MACLLHGLVPFFLGLVNFVEGFLLLLYSEAHVSLIFSCLLEFTECKYVLCHIVDILCVHEGLAFFI